MLVKKHNAYRIETIGEIVRNNRKGNQKTNMRINLEGKSYTQTIEQAMEC